MKKACFLTSINFVSVKSGSIKQVGNLCAGHPDYGHRNDDQYSYHFSHDSRDLLRPFPPFYAKAEKQE